MQLDGFTDYALRVLVYAAVRRDQRCLTAEVATAFGVSRHHIVKVVNELQHLGYLATTRGRTGGFRLARAPELVRVGDVVRRTEGSLAVVECLVDTFYDRIRTDDILGPIFNDVARVD